MRAGALLLALCLAACGNEGAVRLTVGGAGAAGGEGLVLGLRSDDTVRFARRIDGGVAEHRRTPVTEGRDQFLLITTKEPGVDQCKILVLDDRGRLAADYRVSGVTPFPMHPKSARHAGEKFRLLLAPVPSTVVPFTMDGRRLLVLGARDSYAPSSFVLLEAPSRDRLVERLVFWNFGHIHFLSVAAPYVAIVGMSNRFRTEADGIGYPLFVAIFDLRDLPWSDPAAACQRGLSPGPNDPASDEARLYRAYLCFTTDSRGVDDYRGQGWVSARIRDGVLQAAIDSGLVYAIDLETGAFDVRESGTYGERFVQRRARDPGLPELAQHLADLKAGTRVWTKK